MGPSSPVAREDGRVTLTTRYATLVRADNPGPMTLDGTNTWVLRAPGAVGCLVVDPGPDDPGHLDAVARIVSGPTGAGRAGTILLTHRHPDHTAGADALAARLGARVRAALPELCSPGAEPLHDGEALGVDRLRVAVVATPGHTSDSVSLRLPGAILTGDTVLGAGSTVLMERDGGDLGDYLASLDVLAALCQPGSGVVGLPGHGPVVADLGVRVAAYRTHRLERLDEVRRAVAALDLAPDPGTASTVAAVVDRVYPDVTPGLRPAAEQSVRVQLAYLAAAGERPD
jgi:glyoxylase-like metal-dependent hydrolase (beta-lactamase superfamily II)